MDDETLVEMELQAISKEEQADVIDALMGKIDQLEAALGKEHRMQEFSRCPSCECAVDGNLRGHHSAADCSILKYAERARADALRDAADRAVERFMKDMIKRKHGISSGDDYAILNMCDKIRAAILAGEVKEWMDYLLMVMKQSLIYCARHTAQVGVLGIKKSTLNLIGSMKDSRNTSRSICKRKVVENYG